MQVIADALSAYQRTLLIRQTLLRWPRRYAPCKITQQIPAAARDSPAVFLWVMKNNLVKRTEHPVQGTPWGGWEAWQVSGKGAARPRAA